MMHKQQQNEENTTHLYPRNKPQNNLEKIKAEVLKFQIASIKQHRTHSTTALIEKLPSTRHLKR
jgi:3-methyladenine DNA glycosylase AlkC